MLFICNISICIVLPQQKFNFVTDSVNIANKESFNKKERFLIDDLSGKVT